MKSVDNSSNAGRDITAVTPLFRMLSRALNGNIALVVMCMLMPGVAAAADVAVTQLNDSPDPAARGGDITYTISIENKDADTANNVQLTVPLPATTSFISVDNGSCSHTGGSPGTLNCSFGDLLGTAAGAGSPQVVNLVIASTAATGATINITATGSTDSVDGDGSNDSLSQTTSISNGADLTATAMGTPDPVIAGGDVIYPITLSNNGPNDATNPSVVIGLSANMSYSSASGSGWSCSYASGPREVTCDRSGTLSSGTSAPDISFVGKVTGALSGTLTNTLSVSSDTGDPDPNNDVTTVDVQVTSGTDLRMTVGASAGSVIGGNNVTYTLQPRNLGPFDASSVTVTNTLPADFTFVSATGSGWSCNNAGSNPDVITCTRPSYSVGSSNDISVVATTPVVGGSIVTTDTADISSATPEATERQANNTDSVNVTVDPNGVDLSITKVKSPNPVAQGSNMVSTIRVRNHGPLNAASGTITVVDTLANPANETFAGYSGINWSCSWASPDLTCTYNAALNDGSTSSALLVTTTATGTGGMQNSASVSYSGTPGDYDSSNNGTGNISVNATAAIADLRVTSSVDADNSDGDITTLAANEPTASYTITVTNDGPNDVDGITISDNIPVRTTSNGGSGISPSITSAPVGVTFNCTAGSSVNCVQTGGTLASGESVVLTIDASRPLRDGSHTNTASAYSSSVGDDNRSNNTATSTVTVTPVADIEVQSKTVTPTTVKAGVEATYVMTVRNNGPSSAAGVHLLDAFNIPAAPDTGFTFISASPSTGSCSGATAGTSYTNATEPTLDCNLGTLSRGQSETVTVVIRPNWQSGTAARTLDNTATATTTTWESDDTNNDGNGEDEVGSNNIKTATLNIDPAEIDLLVNNSDDTDPLGYDPGTPANNVVTYHVRLTNSGPSLATGTQFTYVMTPKTGKGVTFLCDEAGSGDACGTSADICSVTGGTNPQTGPANMSLTCSLSGAGEVSAGANYDRYLKFRVDSAPASTGDVHNTNATVSANETDSVAANDSEAETTTVRQLVDLDVSKSASINPVQLREPFDWTVTVLNKGPGDSEQTDLSDTLPSGMEFYGATPSWSNSGDGTSGSCVTSGQDVNCDLGKISNGNTATITIPVRMTNYPGGGTAQNCVDATTSEVDPVTGNNFNACGSVTVQRSSSAGRVFADDDKNGVQGGGESGISGVTLTLTGTDAYGNSVSTTATTDANGDFTFTNLSPAGAGGYTITEPTPNGYFDGTDTIGSAGGSQSASDDDVIDSIALGGNQAAAGYLFGEYQGATLSGTVCVDSDGNGVCGGTEPGVAGVTITLSGTTAAAADVCTVIPSCTATSDANGDYSFTVPDSDGSGYTLTEQSDTADPLTGFSDGNDSAGSLGGTTGIVGGNDAISGIVAGVGVTGSGYDFGERGFSFGGIVYLDSSGDGTRGGSEPGIDGVNLTISGVTPDGTSVCGTVIPAAQCSATTDTNGAYSFGDLPAGTYQITESEPTGYTDGQDTIGTGGGTQSGSGPDVIGGISIVSANVDGYLFGETNGGTPGTVSGSVWYNSVTRNTLQDGGEPGLSAWKVEAVRSGSVVATASTDSSGHYSLELPPGNYELRFRNPQSDAIYGDPVSNDPTPAHNGTISSSKSIQLTVTSGVSIIEQNLPVDPSGVVYDSVTRQPLSGADVTLTGPGGFNPATDLVGGAAAQNQTTGVNGFYQFLLNNTAPAGTYTLSVTAPAGYVPGASSTIPPCNNTPTITAAPDPAAVQAQATAPATDTTLHDENACPTTSANFAGGSSTTQYFLTLDLDPSLPSGNVINNHIPVDPVLGGAVALTKRSPKVNVTRGELIPYTITARNTLSSALTNVAIEDRIPAGFKYVEDSARIDDAAVEPSISGRLLTWDGLSIAAKGQKTVTLLLLPGSGVGDGEYVNRAWTMNTSANSRISNIATAAVRLVPDPMADCSDIIGKVYDDRNRNGYQDEGEPGLPGVRVVSVNGLLITTDSHGRFHVACAAVPDEQRGGNFMLKLDERTLPSGYRVTTENPRVVRVTRGKMVKLNFGAALHRVIRLDLNNKAFTDDNELVAEYRNRIGEILSLLYKQPSVLRLAYHVVKDEKNSLAQERLNRVTERIRNAWEPPGCCYDLRIEDEIVSDESDWEVVK